MSRVSALAPRTLADMAARLRSDPLAPEEPPTGPLRSIVGRVRRGAYTVLTLSCGHRVRRVEPSARAICGVCGGDR